MLKIHKPFSKHKLLLIPITSICIAFGLLGFYYLTYTPELSRAEIVNTIDRRTMADITYMQDITPEICANTKEADAEGNYQYQLIDKRDSKTYWVAKLKDGNCWMTQNLDLDIPAEGLKAKDTDIPKDWNANSTYPPKATLDTIDFGYTVNQIESYDPGNKYCGNSSEECNLTQSKNNEHDAQGNYYSFAAATAGQAETLTSDVQKDATQSICPRAWRLPVSGKKGDSALRNTDYTFARLFESYGWTWNEGDYTTTLDGGTQYNMLNAPFYFTASGEVLSTEYGLDQAGSGGTFSSSTTTNSAGAMWMRFTNSWTIIVSPAGGGFRTGGKSIRCVARMEVDNNVEITVNPQISLDVADEVVVEKSETNPSTADLKVKVSSNQPYSVNINAKEHAELVSENGDSIPSNGGALTTAENNWGIMKPGDTIYTKITTTPELFYQAMSAGANDILFKVGISTAPDLANGTYATDIVITTTQN